MEEAGGVSTIAALSNRSSQSDSRWSSRSIRGDEDFDRLTEVYARGKKEFVFAGMRTKFDDADNVDLRGIGPAAERRPD